MLLENQLDKVSLGTLNIFCVSAQLESFSQASEILGLTPATVSRSISRLEKRLGVQLFARTTRHIKLTMAGNTYYQTCKSILLEIQKTENNLTGINNEPQGTLKISLPSTYGYYRLMPILVKFNTQYPRIQLQLDFTNTNVDFIAEGFDLSIRQGVLKDSGLVSKKLENASLGIYATQNYLKKHGIPNDINELDKHRCIQFIMPNTGRRLPWILNIDGKKTAYQPNQPISISGDVLGAINFAKSDGGIFQTYDYIAQHKQPELIEILKSTKGASRPFSFVYPYNRYMPQKLRLIIDFIDKEIDNLLK